MRAIETYREDKGAKSCNTATCARWTADEVWTWMCEATDTLQRLPDPDRAFRGGLKAAWPDYVTTREGEAGRMRLGPPEPGAIDRMHRVIGWLGLLPPEMARVVWARAAGTRTATLASQTGLSRWTVAQRVMEATVLLAREVSAKNI